MTIARTLQYHPNTPSLSCSIRPHITANSQIQSKTKAVYDPVIPVHTTAVSPPPALFNHVLIRVPANLLAVRTRRRVSNADNGRTRPLIIGGLGLPPVGSAVVLASGPSKALGTHEFAVVVAVGGGNEGGVDGKQD